MFKTAIISNFPSPGGEVSANGHELGFKSSPAAGWPRRIFSQSSGFPGAMDQQQMGRKRPLAFSIDALLADGPRTYKMAKCGGGEVKQSMAQMSPTTSSSSPALHWALQRCELNLEGAELWRRFHALSTEMIVTRSGRRMFPTLQLQVARLERNMSYSLMVDFQCTDRKRYRYSFHQSKWVVAGPGEAEFPARMHVHPGELFGKASDSPATGEHWMRQQVITFDKVKLTNNLLDRNGHAIVNSMHRYQPRFHLVVHPPAAAVQLDTISRRRTFVFPETVFMAVTAYQNHRITELKIECNPFAKGFRECDLLPLGTNGTTPLGATLIGNPQISGSPETISALQQWIAAIVQTNAMLNCRNSAMAETEINSINADAGDQREK